MNDQKIRRIGGFKLFKLIVLIIGIGIALQNLWLVFNPPKEPPIPYVQFGDKPSISMASVSAPTISDSSYSIESERFESDPQQQDAPQQENPSKEDKQYEANKKVPYFVRQSDGQKVIAVVGTGGSDAVFYYYRKNAEGIWELVVETDADVGKNGITGKKREGDGKTPSGVYSFTLAFGILDNPGALMEYRKVKNTSYWVDDGSSPYYNQWVESDEVQGSFSSEHLIEHNPSYRYALNISYNTQREPGLGSAIFLHCKNGSGETAGCIAIEEQVLKQMLLEIDSETKLYIYKSKDSMPPYDEDMVEISEFSDDIKIDLKYATTDNFTNTKIYDFERAYLRYGTLKKLLQAQEILKEQGYAIKIWDAYRPQSAQYKLWSVYPDSKYVANPNTGYSSHTRGNAIDITVIKDSNDIKMPTGFDEFTSLADRDYSDCSDEAKANAKLLEEAMVQSGFVPYRGEWWHFSDSDEYNPLESVDALTDFQEE